MENFFSISIVLWPLAYFYSLILVIASTENSPRNALTLMTTALGVTVIFMRWWFGIIVWLLWQYTSWSLALSVPMILGSAGVLLSSCLMLAQRRNQEGK